MPFSIRPFRRSPVINGKANPMSRLLLIALLVNPDTIRRKEEMVRMWILNDFKTMQTVSDHSHLSIKGREEYDCNGECSRTLTFTEFSGNMGAGKAVHTTSCEGAWVPVDPESVAHGLWEFACGKK
jgi:hypothetical protein